MLPILLTGFPEGSSLGLVAAFEWLGQPYRLARVDMLGAHEFDEFQLTLRRQAREPEQLDELAQWKQQNEQQTQLQERKRQFWTAFQQQGQVQPECACASAGDHAR